MKLNRLPKTSQKKVEEPEPSPGLGVLKPVFLNPLQRLPTEEKQCCPEPSPLPSSPPPNSPAPGLCRHTCKCCAGTPVHTLQAHLCVLSSTPTHCYGFLAMLPAWARPKCRPNQTPDYATWSNTAFGDFIAGPAATTNTKQ